MTILPSLQRILSEVGENIRLARLRRKLSMEQVAERAGMSRNTLQKIEEGDSSTSMTNYAKVLFVLGLEKDLLRLAEDDEMGKKIQDAELLVGRRAPKQ